ncbi:MAG: NADH-quinone oxidoreductase subunit NuoE [Candidatus Riflebacteria bacterium]|nr:NADH-quinone oxidoreductase subunit NuoE [Candidatus Riflebacteria bacterium]
MNSTINVEASKTREFSEFYSTLGIKFDEPGQLIPLLQRTQDKYGYIPETAITVISKITNTPESEIFGVITFYKQFRLKPLGKNLIRLCDGTACHVNNAKTLQNLLQEELHLTDDDTTSDGLFTLQPVACLGCCSLAPVIMINNETYGRLTPKKVREILNTYRKKSGNKGSEKKGGL